MSRQICGREQGERRLSGGVLLVAASTLFYYACSSGLEGDGAKGTNSPGQPAESTNLRIGFDPGIVLTQPITDSAVAGGVLPKSTGSGERPVAFLAFVTAARADDGDGAGHALDSDGIADTNDASDVFVAAIDTDAIDPRAFSYALAGKMRHPRCITCHQMNVDTTVDPTAIPVTAFKTAPHEGGPPPLNDTTDQKCKQCHFADWKSPKATFDLRNEPAFALFGRAKIAPTGLAEHFLHDPRVHWALGDGRSPFGNAADDDQDGIAEPEDTDGTIRTVPGGVPDFLTRFNDWEASGLIFDSAQQALEDVALVSRNAAGNAAGDSAAFSPSLVYSVNPAYVHGTSNPDVVPVGFLRVAFASDATNMVGGTANAATDVFRAGFSVFQRASGAIDIVYANQLLISEDSAGGDADGASTDPDIGGPNGERVAFASQATDLLVSATPAGNVYVHNVPSGTTDLVSHIPTSTTTAGNGSSSNPDMSADGAFVAYESDASDIVDNDTNGARDVFFYKWSSFVNARASVDSSGNEGTGGDARNASIFVFPGAADVRVAFESTMQSLVSTLPRADSNVFLRDTRGGGSTLLLNQIIGPKGVQLPTATSASGAPVAADAFNPAISPLGNAVAFESLARDLDFVRPHDENRQRDVVLVDLLQLDAQGFVLPYEVSVTADGGHANGSSSAPRFGAFTPATDAFPLGLLAFATAATNLGNSDPADIDGDGVPDGDNHMVLGLREGASVLAYFEARPAKQGQNLEVAFEDHSSGKPTNFQWDFGDGSTSTEENPKHVYTTPDLYTVSLNVSGELGSDDRVRQNYIEVLGPVISHFLGTKDFSASGVPTQGAATNVRETTKIVGAIDDPAASSALTFNFDSTPSTQSPDTFQWNLQEVDGSGNPIGGPVDLLTASTATTTIDRTGFFDVSLHAAGLGGSGADATQRLEVYQRVVAQGAATSAAQGNAPLTVSFADQSVGDVSDVQWDFDDGASSTLSNPSHQFAEGVFNVIVRANGLGGDFDLSNAIQVVALGDITANFNASPTEAIASGPVNVSFTNTTSGTSGVTLFFHWAFGNGLTSTQTSPTTSYSLSSNENKQTFNVLLVASTDNPAPVNCTGLGSTECDEQAGTITLFPALSVSFSFGASFKGTTTRPPHTVAFTGSVTGDGNTNPTYSWFRSSAGGSTANTLFSNALSPTFEFPDPGIYKVFLRVSTDAPSGAPFFGRQTVDSSVQNVTVTASKFTEFFAQAVNQPLNPNKCTNCHNAGFTPDWTNVNEAYDDLVNVNGNCNPSFKRVIPNDPTNSLLVDLLSHVGNVSDPTASGCSSMQGNLPTNASVADHLAVLKSWINGGALDN